MNMFCHVDFRICKALETIKTKSHEANKEKRLKLLKAASKYPYGVTNKIVLKKHMQ